jgi:hypothetical protein
MFIDWWWYLDCIDIIVVCLTAILCILVYLSSDIHNGDDTP